jgi:uncharacterized protein
VRILTIVLLAALAAAPAWAADAPPTDESIKKLFEAAHTSAMIDTAVAQMQTSLKGTAARKYGGQQLNAEQQQIIADSQDRIFGVIREALNWKDLEPSMLATYRDTFTQKEVDGMLKFYTSPTGKAVLDKMPQTMSTMMQHMTARMQDLAPKLEQIQRETAEKVKAAATAPQTGDSSAPASPSAPQSPSPPPASH